VCNKPENLKLVGFVVNSTIETLSLSEEKVVKVKFAGNQSQLLYLLLRAPAF